MIDYNEGISPCLSKGHQNEGPAEDFRIPMAGEAVW